MSTLKHIVVATDLSPASRHSSDRGAQLAHSQHARMTLVHALASSLLDALRQWLGEGGEVQALEADARERLQELARQLRERYGTNIDEQLLLGHPLQQITQCAEQSDADLVISGTRGAGSFRGMVVGSTAERLAKRSTRPVLMVRQSVHGAYRRVLVPVDFSAWSLHALRWAARVAPGAPVVLMHAISVPFEGRMRLGGATDETIARYRSHVRADALGKLQHLAELAGLVPSRVRLSVPEGGDPWQLVAQEEQEHDCDLIVIGRQGRHAVDEWLLGSTTRMVLAECSADVLVSVQTGSAPGLDEGLAGGAGN